MENEQITFRSELPRAEDACSFLSKAFRRPFKKPTWIWKHRKNPAGESKLFVARHKWALVGLRPLWRVNLAYQQKTINAVEGVDVAVSRYMRRRGIFRKLNRTALNSISGTLIFNSANKNIYPAYLNFGWIDIGGLDSFVRPLSIRSGLRYLKNYFLSGLNPTNTLEIGDIIKSKLICTSYPATIGEILAAHKRSLSHLITVESNLAWLRWRTENPDKSPYYYFCPDVDRPFLIVFSVRRKGELTGVHVLDTFADYNSKALLKKELSSFIRFARQHFDYIFFLCTMGHPLRRLLLRTGFIRVYRGNFVADMNESIQLSEKLVANPNSWALMSSAFDTA